MQTPKDLVNQDWFTFLSTTQQQLMQTSLLLLEQAEDNFDVPDFGYIIFPAAKAYEGVLKKYLFEVGLLDEHEYSSRRFRIGRALNPDIRDSHQDERWLYDDLAQQCGEAMARQLWDTWLECRNHVFHFFPGEEEIVTLPQAKEKLQQIIESLSSLVVCYDQNHIKESHV